MNTLSKIATTVAVSLGLAAIAAAHPMEESRGQHAHQSHQHGMQGGMGHGHAQAMQRGTDVGAQHGPRHGMTGGMQPRTQASELAEQLMTTDERSALQEKMRAAKTPEERQQIAAATRTEMQKRAAEKGIALPDRAGPHGRGMGIAGTGHKH